MPQQSTVRVTVTAHACRPPTLTWRNSPSGAVATTGELAGPSQDRVASGPIEQTAMPPEETAGSTNVVSAGAWVRWVKSSSPQQSTVPSGRTPQTYSSPAANRRERAVDGVEVNVFVGAPARRVAVGAQTADEGSADGDVDEGPAGGSGTHKVSRPPAHGGAVHAQSARGAGSGDHRGERDVGQITPAGAECSPADWRAVRSQSAGVERAGSQGGESTGRGLELPVVVVVAPADCPAGRAQSAREAGPAAQTDEKSAGRVGRADLLSATAPADRRTPRCGARRRIRRRR